MATKVINTDLVYRSLTISSNKKTQLRKSGYPIAHSNKIKASKKNNIITVRFLSGGVSKKSFEKEVLSYKNYFETEFDTDVFYDKREFAEALIIKRKSSGNVIVNFVYVNTKFPGREDNEGIKYEKDLISKLNEFGYTKQTKPEEIDGNDVTVTVGDIAAGIEIKEKLNVAFGSGTLVFSNNKWNISDRSNPSVKRLVKTKLLDWINEMWYEKTKNYIPNSVAKKEDQQVLGGGTGYYKEIDSSFIAEYYDKSDYIHVKGKGFYSLNDKNPLNISSADFSKFQPRKTRARIRVKGTGGGKYVYKIEFYVGELSNSSNKNGLDGDLKFLGEV